VHAKLRRRRGVRVARPMRSAALCGLVRPTRPDDDPRTGRAPGARRRAARLPAARAQRALVADLTQVATWEGPLYVAVVLDCYSRRVVGWALAEHMRAELVVERDGRGAAQASIGLVHQSD
jgi:putative transposase